MNLCDACIFYKVAKATSIKKTPLVYHLVSLFGFSVFGDFSFFLKSVFSFSLKVFFVFVSGGMDFGFSFVVYVLVLFLSFFLKIDFSFSLNVFFTFWFPFPFESASFMPSFGFSESLFLSTSFFSFGIISSPFLNLFSLITF